MIGMETFQLNYPSHYEFLRGFLAPIKTKLDSKHLNDDWISFNYFLDEKNKNNVRIVPYDVNPSHKITLDEEQVEMIEKANKNSRKIENFESQDSDVYMEYSVHFNKAGDFENGFKYLNKAVGQAIK